MNAKDLMIDLRKEEAEEEYQQWLEFVDSQQEWLSRLMEQGYIPTPKETYHAEVQH